MGSTTCIKIKLINLLTLNIINKHITLCSSSFEPAALISPSKCEKSPPANIKRYVSLSRLAWLGCSIYEVYIVAAVEIWSPFWCVLRPTNEHAYCTHLSRCACASTVCLCRTWSPLVFVICNYKTRIRRIGQSRAAIASAMCVRRFFFDGFLC